jgi:hypothetical protein
MVMLRQEVIPTPSFLEFRLLFAACHCFSKFFVTAARLYPYTKSSGMSRRTSRATTYTRAPPAGEDTDENTSPILMSSEGRGGRHHQCL